MARLHKLTFNIDPYINECLRVYVATHDTYIRSVVNEAIKEYIEKRDPEGNVKEYVDNERNKDANAVF